MPTESEAKDLAVERAQLVRIHQSNCEIDHPTPEELRFRMATMMRLAELLDYRSVKGVSLVVSPAPTPKAARS